MAGTVYKYEWLSPRSGFEFKLEIFEGGSIWNDWEAIVELPPTSIQLKNMDGFAFGDYPTNFGKAHAGNFEVDFNLLSNPIYDDFHTLILNPKRSGGAVIYFDVNPNAQTVTLKLGTIIHLYVKAHGKDAVIPVAWRKLKTFVHRDGIDEDDIWNIIENVARFKTVDINKFILEQSDFKLLKNLYTGPYWEYTYSYNLYDFVNVVPLPEPVRPGFGGATSVNYALMQKGQQEDHVFIFVGYNDVFGYVNNYAKSIYRSLMGDFTADYSIDYPAPTMNKQLYNATGGTGASLSQTNIYRIMQVRKDEKTLVDGQYTQDYDKVIVGGMYSEQDENSFENMYKSCWDFLCDVFEANSCKAVYRHDGIIYSPALKFSNQSFDVQDILETAEVSMKINLIGKTTSSMFDFKNSSKYNDLSNYVENAPGNRNGKELTLPIYENNMPLNVEAERFNKIGEQSWTEVAAPLSIDLQRQYHSNNLYYFDNPSPIIKSGKTAAIRIHEKVDYVVGGPWTSNVWNTPVPTIDYSYYFNLTTIKNNVMYDSSKLFELIEKIQDSGLCIHGVANKKIMELFGDYPNQFPARNANIELPFYDITYFGTDWSEDMRFGGLDPQTKIIFALNELNPKVIDATNNWLILESSIDFTKETAKLRIINVKDL